MFSSVDELPFPQKSCTESLKGYVLALMCLSMLYQPSTGLLETTIAPIHREPPIIKCPLQMEGDYWGFDIYSVPIKRDIVPQGSVAATAGSHYEYQYLPHEYCALDLNDNNFLEPPGQNFVDKPPVFYSTSVSIKQAVSAMVTYCLTILSRSLVTLEWKWLLTVW